jgi:ribosome-associated protein
MKTPAPKRSASDAGSDARAFALGAARLASELKCADVIVLDMKGRSPVCDFMVIASGTSPRQMKSVATEISKLGKSQSSAPWRMSADEGSSWICADFVDVVLHLFEPGQREWYDLEGLWSDASRVEWRSGADAKEPVSPRSRTRPTVP